MPASSYEVEGGSPIDREHLWFEVHGITGDQIDATLTNRPFRVPGLTAGERRVHDIARLTDWTTRAQTPAGQASEFTSQLYFPENLNDEVHALAPYNQKGRRDVLNERDGILNGIRDKRERDSVIVKLEPGDRLEAQALVGTFDIVLGA